MRVSMNTANKRKNKIIEQKFKNIEERLTVKRKQDSERVNMQWVKVEDQLPPDGEKVLCLTSGYIKDIVPPGWQSEIYEGYFRRRSGWRIPILSTVQPEVTAWMPRPKDPEFINEDNSNDRFHESLKGLSEGFKRLQGDKMAWAEELKNSEDLLGP